MAKETGQSSPKRTSTPKAAQDLLEEADESLENPSRPRWGLMAVGVTSLAAGIHQFTDIDGPFVLKSFFE